MSLAVDPVGLVIKVGPWLWARGRSWLVGRKFRKVFGPGVSQPGYALIYAELALAPPYRDYPYIKPGGDPRFGFSISRPVSACELRAATYLASAVGEATGRTPTLRSDVETRATLDLDFVSFGGPESNLKSRDCQTNPGNELAQFDQAQGRFLRLPGGELLTDIGEGRFDYGLILKVRPKQFPGRVWLMCAGLGEWGTSGSAWFLSRNWREIEKTAGDSQFALVVRVRPDQDQSAEKLSLVVGKD